MTIASSTSRATYDGNGSTCAFSIPFVFTKNADIEVTLRGADGVETVQTLTTHYTLTGAGNAAGGECAMVTAPAAGERLVVRRVPAIVQETDYVENDAFPAASHEAALDLLTMICQGLSERMDRAVALPVSSTASGVHLPEPEAGRLLIWNGAAENLENGPTADAIATAQTDAVSANAAAAQAQTARDEAVAAAGSVPTCSEFGGGLMNTADATNARSTLGLGSAAVEDVAPGGSGDLLRADGDASALTGLTAQAEVLSLRRLLTDTRMRVMLGQELASLGAPSTGFSWTQKSDEYAVKTGGDYDAVNDIYSNYGPTTRTATDACSGGTVAASHAGVGGNVAANAYDNDTGTMWAHSGVAQSGQWLGYLFSGSKRIWKARFRTAQDSAYTPFGVTVDYTTDGGTTWTPTREYSGWGWPGSGVWVDIALDEPLFCNGLRLRVTQPTTSYSGAYNWSVGECEMLEALAPGDMTLVPSPVDLGNHNYAVAGLLMDLEAGVTLNTDVTFKWSKDGGTTWSAAGTIEFVWDFDENHGLYLCEFDTAALGLAGDGSQSAWKLETANGKKVAVRMVSAQVW